MIWIGLRDVATRSEDGSDRAVPWFYRNFVRLPTTTFRSIGGCLPIPDHRPDTVYTLD